MNQSTKNAVMRGVSLVKLAKRSASSSDLIFANKVFLQKHFYYQYWKYFLWWLTSKCSKSLVECELPPVSIAKIVSSFSKIKSFIESPDKFFKLRKFSLKFLVILLLGNSRKSLWLNSPSDQRLQIFTLSLIWVRYNCRKVTSILKLYNPRQVWSKVQLPGLQLSSTLCPRVFDKPYKFLFVLLFFIWSHSIIHTILNGAESP